MFLSHRKVEKRHLTQSRRARQGPGRHEEPPRNGPGFRADRLPLGWAFFFTGEPDARGTIPLRERSSRGPVSPPRLCELRVKFPYFMQNANGHDEACPSVCETVYFPVFRRVTLRLY